MTGCRILLRLPVLFSPLLVCPYLTLTNAKSEFTTLRQKGKARKCASFLFGDPAAVKPPKPSCVSSGVILLRGGLNEKRYLYPILHYGRSKRFGRIVAFFVPWMFQWYDYLPMQYENLIVGIDYTNYCFSLLLFGLSAMLIILDKRALKLKKK